MILLKSNFKTYFRKDKIKKNIPAFQNPAGNIKNNEVLQYQLFDKVLGPCGSKF